MRARSDSTRDWASAPSGISSRLASNSAAGSMSWKCNWRSAKASARCLAPNPQATSGDEPRLALSMGARYGAARVLGFDLLRLLAFHRADGSGARLEPRRAQRGAVAGSARLRALRLPRRRLDR